jgi:hypothetical protein
MACNNTKKMNFVPHKALQFDRQHLMLSVQNVSSLIKLISVFCKER